MPPPEPYEVLEREFSAWAHAPNIVACSSGTAALHLALEALQLPPGSECVIPDFSMVACARAVTLAGLVPVFADVSRHDLLLCPESAGDLITDNTRAIMYVHTYGRRCDRLSLNELADKYGLYVIEDLAEAHGVTPHTRSDAYCWSFYRNKIVRGEEGGAVGFKNPDHAEIARSLRCLGFTRDHDFRHVPRGHNYRMSNLHAGAVLPSLRQASLNLHDRRLVEQAYDAYCPEQWKLPMRDKVWVYDLRIPELTQPEQDRVVSRLRASGVQARHGFKPLSSQPEYSQPPAKKKPRRPANPEAYAAAREVIYLPVEPAMASQAFHPEPVFEVIKRTLAE